MLERLVRALQRDGDVGLRSSTVPSGAKRLDHKDVMRFTVGMEVTYTCDTEMRGGGLLPKDNAEWYVATIVNVAGTDSVKCLHLSDGAHRFVTAGDAHVRLA